MGIYKINERELRCRAMRITYSIREIIEATLRF